MADDIIRIRRDTLANWTAVNPVLAIGEISYDTTSEELRIGDGATAWLSLMPIGTASVVPINATYITQVADGTLTNEFALGSLATGIVKNTTTTGVLSIAVGSDLPSHTHALSDLTVSGAAANQVPAWSGSAWVPWTPGVTTTDNNTATTFYPVFSTSAQANAPFYVDATTAMSGNTGRLNYVPSTGQLTVGSLQSTGIVAGSDFNNVELSTTSTGVGTITMTSGRELTINSNLTFNHSAAAANTIAVHFGSVSGLTVAYTNNFGTGVAAFLAAPTSANLIAAMTNETGTGSLVFSDSPTLVTPILGTPTSGNLSNCTNLPAHTHALSDLTVSGAIANQVPAWSGSAWVPVTPAAAVADGDKGDITVSSSGTVWDIDAGAVTTTELGGDITTAGKALLDDADAAAQRTTLGLGALATLADAPALTLTGTALNSAIVTSSLTSVGTLAALTVTAPIAGSVTGNAATVTTNANLTGHITSTGNATLLGAFTSLQLKTALSDETGSGAAVFADTPTLVTPILGTPTSGDLSNCTNLPSHTHALADLTVSGAIANQVPAWSGTAWVPVTPGTPVTDGDKGDITVSSSGTVWNIDAATVGLTELSATGTPSASNFLRGDNAWDTVVAADIVSGTLATARLGSGTATSSTWLRGDGTWATVNNFDPCNPSSEVWQWDDMQPCSVESGEAGVLNWQISNGSMTAVAAELNHPGIIRHRCSGTINQMSFMSPTSGTSGTQNQVVMSDVYEHTWIFRNSNTGTGDCYQMVGFFENVSSVTPNGIYVKLDLLGDWKFYTRQSGAETTVTGWTDDAGWHNCKFVKSAGVWSFYHNGTLMGSSSTNLPTSTTIMTYGSASSPTAASLVRRLDLDFFSSKYTGQTR